MRQHATLSLINTRQLSIEKQYLSEIVLGQHVQHARTHRGWRIDQQSFGIELFACWLQQSSLRGTKETAQQTLRRGPEMGRQVQKSAFESVLGQGLSR